METSRYIGIDLHRNQFTCCVRLENGREYLSEWKLEDLERFTKKLRSTDQLAVEVTGNTRLFHDAVKPYVARVVAVDPNQFKVISHSVKKTDPNDARNLALYLAKDLLPEVRMKDKTQVQVAVRVRMTAGVCSQKVVGVGGQSFALRTKVCGWRIVASSYSLMCDRFDWLDSRRRPRFLSQSPRAFLGGSRFAPASGSAEAQASPTVAEPRGPALLDRAAQGLAAMVECCGHRETGDGDRMASSRL